MADTFTANEAFEAYEAWYEKCLESGIEPEAIVERMGEMKLLVNQDQIDLYEKVAEDWIQSSFSAV